VTSPFVGLAWSGSCHRIQIAPQARSSRRPAQGCLRGERRARRSFTEEFKADAVAMVLDDGGRIIDVAQSLGIGEGTLGNWVRLEKIERRERAGLTRDDRAELVELRKENARLRMERDLLKRATAFWVKESGQ
jgi:transposase